jgi:hypothetical protein
MSSATFASEFQTLQCTKRDWSLSYLQMIAEVRSWWYLVLCLALRLFWAPHIAQLLLCKTVRRTFSQLQDAWEVMSNRCVSRLFWNCKCSLFVFSALHSKEFSWTTELNYWVMSQLNWCVHNVAGDYKKVYRHPITKISWASVMWYDWYEDRYQSVGRIELHWVESYWIELH